MEELLNTYYLEHNEKKYKVQLYKDNMEYKLIPYSGERKLVIKFGNTNVLPSYKFTVNNSLDYKIEKDSSLTEAFLTQIKEDIKNGILS